MKKIMIFLVFSSIIFTSCTTTEYVTREEYEQIQKDKEERNKKTGTVIKNGIIVITTYVLIRECRRDNGYTYTPYSRWRWW